MTEPTLASQIMAPPAPSTSPTLPAIYAAVRTLVAMAGGFAIARGWATADQVGEIAGAVAVLVTAGLAITSQVHNKRDVAQALALPPQAPTGAAK